jgi:hypothetical protein
MAPLGLPPSRSADLPGRHVLALVAPGTGRTLDRTISRSAAACCRRCPADGLSAAAARASG